MCLFSNATINLAPKNPSTDVSAAVGQRMPTETFCGLCDMQRDVATYQQIYAAEQKHMLPIRLLHENFQLVTQSPPKSMSTKLEKGLKLTTASS
jgi:hypothetical protein